MTPDSTARPPSNVQGPDRRGPAPDEIAAHLAATRLFSLLTPDSLATIGAAFESVDAKAGEAIARQGSIDSALWILITGSLGIRARRRDGSVESLGYRGYGAVVGTRGVFTDEPRTTTVEAVEPSRLLVADRDALWAALSEDPQAFDRLLLPDEARQKIEAARSGTPLDGEIEIGRYRRHWVELLGRLVLPAGVGLVVLAAAAAAASFASSPVVIAVFALLGLGLPLLFTGWTIFDYLHDELIVTNRRIIQIERTPFIDAQRSEAMLYRVQDVQVVTPGIVATILGYGTIEVLTAGSRHGIRFTRLPRPEHVRGLIFGQVERVREVAKRRRTSWLERKVREALGYSDPRESGERGPGDHRPGIDREHGPGRDGAFDRPEIPDDAPGWWGATFGYFWPKMRHEHGSKVTWRKHWWVLVKTAFVPATICVLTGVPVAIAVFGWLAGIQADDGLVAGIRTWPIGVLSVGWLVAFVVVLYQYEDWRNERYVLTDEHLIDVEALPLGLFEERRQTSLAQVQDIRYRVPHMWATLLGYGDVVIETAAESGNFTFDNVYRPEVVQQEIFARIERMRAEQQAAEERRQADEMARWLAAYHRVTGNEAAAPGADEPRRPAEPRDDARSDDAPPDRSTRD